MRNTPRLAIGASAAVLLLGACGGGSTGSATTETPMQAEDRAASASIDGLMAFAKEQITSSTTDTGEPRDISGITPRTSETGEPLPID